VKKRGTAKKTLIAQQLNYDWQKVTPLSKVLALALFIIFPIIGFLFGRLYEFCLSMV
jgi:hypothetical protein